MPPPIASYRLIAAPREDTCLGFVNTLYWRGSPVPTETLKDWAGLLDWCEHNLGCGAEEVRALTDWAAAQPAAAHHLFELAIAMREVLWRVLGALASGTPVVALDLAAFNQALAEAPPRAELAHTDGGFVWRTGILVPAMPALLAPVLWSAADLMTQASHELIRQCANPKCLYLFVDASKAGTRRWCDMNSCGNRAKAQRHYQKTRQA